MAQIELEIKNLKEELVNMGYLVKAQLQKSKTALTNFDKNLAREIVIKEKTGEWLRTEN